MLLGTSFSELNSRYKLVMPKRLTPDTEWDIALKRVETTPESCGAATVRYESILCFNPLIHRYQR